jgi:ribosomal protein S12 methylthiotransferase accessory factor
MFAPAMNTVLQLMRSSVGWRSGILARAQSIPVGAADLPLHHWSATEDLRRDRNAAGGVGRTSEIAEIAAIGEGLERYAAWTCPLQPQPLASLPESVRVLTGDDFSLFSADQQRAGLLNRLHDAYTWVRPMNGGALLHKQQVFAPAGLVALNPEHGGIATSSGLAAHSSLRFAQLRAIQELLERDALMMSWVWGISPPQVELPAELVDPVVERGGSVAAFDITQAWNPHPVVAVLGDLPLEGRPRYAMGSACRSTVADAADKAWLEWNQGTLFAGYYVNRNAGLSLRASEVKSFEHHAGYYSLPNGPGQFEWDGLPIWKATNSTQNDYAMRTYYNVESLELLANHLSDVGVELFTRELTTVDLAQIGVHVARVLSPQLVPIHVEHGAPYLGGTGSDVAWRYPGMTHLADPSPFPHPLG